MAIPRGAELPERSPVSPGEILIEEFLRPLGLSQTEAAARMGIPLNRLNEIIHGKRGISAQTALRLADLLGTTPRFWLNLQMALDLYQAQRDLDRVKRHADGDASQKPEHRRHRLERNVPAGH